jgi:hypothetical protein
MRGQTEVCSKGQTEVCSKRTTKARRAWWCDRLWCPGCVLVG